MRAITFTGMWAAYCGGGVDDGLARRDVAEVVEALLAQQPDLGLPRLDLLRRERRQQQAPGQLVERRIAA